MARRSKYSLEFQEEAVRLSRQPGHTFKSVGADLGLSRETIRRWAIELAADPIVRQARAEHLELVALRRRVQVLEEEREILAKAAAFRARETERPR